MENNPDKALPHKPNQQLSDPLITKFLETQHQKALNEAEQIKLRAKELDNNKELSSKYMDIEAKLEAEKPKENRKTYTRIAYIGFGFLLVFLGFIVFCLYLGKEQFLIELIKVALYPILTFAGYYLGKNTKSKKKKKDEFDEADVVND